MIVDELVRRYREGELTGTEVCSMAVEAGDTLQLSDLKRLISAEPSLRQSLMVWLRAVAQGEAVFSSGGQITMPPAIRVHAAQLLADFVAARPHVVQAAQIAKGGLAHAKANGVALSGNPFRLHVAVR